MYVYACIQMRCFITTRREERMEERRGKEIMKKGRRGA